MGAKPNSSRYDPSMTSEERSDPSNGIYLCRICSKKIDDDEEGYSAEALRRWKRDAEKRQRDLNGKPPMLRRPKDADTDESYGGSADDESEKDKKGRKAKPKAPAVKKQPAAAPASRKLTPAELHDVIERGDRVYITGGKWKGIYGSFVKLNGANWLIDLDKEGEKFISPSNLELEA